MYATTAVSTGPTPERVLPSYVAEAGPLLFSTVRVEGEGEALVIVEGRDGPEDDWQELERFARGLRLVDVRPRMRFNVLKLPEGAAAKVALNT